jgi:hypothetical protein
MSMLEWAKSRSNHTAEITNSISYAMRAAMVFTWRHEVVRLWVPLEPTTSRVNSKALDLGRIVVALGHATWGQTLTTRAVVSSV